MKMQAKREKQVAVPLLGTRLIEREASCRQINGGSPQAAESAGIKKSHMPQVFEENLAFCVQRRGLDTMRK